MARKFQRKKEDFICEYCHASMKGDGYTNHCTACLWSKHVDVNPGDRQNDCGGMMRPVRIEMDGHERNIIFCCEKCGHEGKNKESADDDFDALLRIAKNNIKEKNKY